MRKGKNVVGQAVVSFEEGRRIDTVKDLLISESNDGIVALLVDEGGLLSSSRVVSIEAVRSFGRDAVVIGDAKSVIPASDDPEVRSIINRKEKLLGKRVVTDTGDLMGSVSDVYFEEGTGRILGFEVSGGMLGDMARGTSFLAVEEIERLGPDVIFVRPETGENLEGQVGGLQGALQDAGDKVGEAASRAGEQAQLGLAEREPERALIGRRSGMDVADENGSIVLAKGQRIRAEHVEWARGSNNIGPLTRAAAAGQTAETGARAGAALEGMGDNLGAAWDRFTRRIAEMRDDQGRQADEQQTRTRLAQIADAVGRPVGKVILDRNDNVILDFGDIITHQAVQQAYDAGMLDTLLGSVYHAQFGLPLDQLRAGQPASGTVQKASGGAQVVDELEQKTRQMEQQRADEEQRRRQEAEMTVEQRERQRQERAQARQEAEQERQREIEEARRGAEEPAPGATAEEATSPGDRHTRSTTEYEAIPVETPT
jgi:uncharacterized protein YrrD